MALNVFSGQRKLSGMIDFFNGRLAAETLDRMMRGEEDLPETISYGTSDDSITEITAACGFTNKTHLKNLFRRCTGLSMRDYRKSV